MITIVTVPAGSCVLVAQGAPAFGGRGGTPQEWAAGTPSGPNCAGLQFLPAADYINQQPIGAYALLYAPRAGGGNAGSVASALDRGPYAAPYTGMDEVYKSLDLLNFGDPAPLRAALVQLDGEIYADYSSIAIGGGQLFLGAVRNQMRAVNPTSGPVQQWLTALGGSTFLSGNGDSHSVSAGMGGLAGGVERHFDPTLLAGVAVGFAAGGFGTSGISGSGTISTLAVTPYVRYSPGPWYVEAAVGYGYSMGDVNRDMFFINRDLYSSGATLRTNGTPTGNAFLSQVETGYRIDVDTRTSITPFAAMQGIVFGQNSFVESGGDAVDLHVLSHTTDLALSILGTEICYTLPTGQVATPLRFNGRLGWAHDFASMQRSSTAFLDGTPSAASFTVLGAPRFAMPLYLVLELPNRCQGSICSCAMKELPAAVLTRKGGLPGSALFSNCLSNCPPQRTSTCWPIRREGLKDMPNPRWRTGHPRGRSGQPRPNPVASS
jgi:outer membrane autotransporter protein